MSGNSEEITVDISNYSELENAEVHLIPCTIDYNGPAKVSEFFKPSLVPKDTDELQTNREWSASFRGRPLEGCKISLPSGYVGVVMSQSSNYCGEDIQLNLSNKFNDITYWNLDCTSSSNDKIVQAMKWINISQAIHSSVTEEDSSESSVASI